MYVCFLWCNVALPLMPKATAIWLVDNTALTFEQIAEFCGMHVLEVEAIANGELGTNMSGFDPIIASQLTQEEIARCEADPTARLMLQSIANYDFIDKTKKYIAVSKRQNKPDAIAWLLKYYPEIAESDVCSLLGTTKITVRSIKNKTHRNFNNIVPKSPVVLGICTEKDLAYIIEKSKKE